MGVIDFSLYLKDSALTSNNEDEDRFVFLCVCVFLQIETGPCAVYISKASCILVAEILLLFWPWVLDMNMKVPTFGKGSVLNFTTPKLFKTCII